MVRSHCRLRGGGTAGQACGPHHPRTMFLRSIFWKILALIALGATASHCLSQTQPGSGGRAFHFAGGRMKSSVRLGENYSVAFWLWNALPADARPVTGYAF